MKKINFFLLAVVAFVLTSCGAYIASYSVGLTTVESPADAKQQFGETKVVTFDDKGVNKYRYEDDYINIVWFVDMKRFNFTLTNKSGHTLKINWDDVSYVDINGQVGRVMHSGVKYAERNNSQPATTLPKGASLTDMLLPTENVYFASGMYGGWRENYLIPCVYKTPSALNAGASSLVGKAMTIMMPIMIENVQNDYTFTFNIDKLLNNTTK
jgi:putative lipoprotein